MGLKYFKRSSLALTALLLVCEILARSSGIVDFPIYATDTAVGYLPRPSQHGKFLNRNAWVFNDRSMGTELPWNPHDKPNLLLIGNSIVMGGNPYDQPDKLGPLLQARLGGGLTVWPIGVGGWSTVNESAFLEQNPDIAHAGNFFVWEYMSGGLSRLSLERGQYVFPTEPPLLASWYALRRYVLPRFMDFQTDELPPTGQSNFQNLQRFEKLLASMSGAARDKGAKTPGILFFYPSRDELQAFRKGVDYLSDRRALEAIASTNGLVVLDVAQQPQWTPELYREGTHPTAEGNKVLADILSKAIHQAL